MDISDKVAAGLSAFATMLGRKPGGLQFTLVTDSLPAGTFSVAAFELDEQLSQPFHLGVELASHNPAVDFAAVLDKGARLSIWQDGVLQRTVSGIVSDFEQGDSGFHRSRYRMEIRPALWRCGLRQNSRIFQEADIETILATLMQEHKIEQCQFVFQFSHPQREFCVQYCEDDLSFIQRLCAEEGIFYFYDNDRLIFTDHFSTLPLRTRLPYNANRAAQLQEATVQTFRQRQRVRPGRASLKDYTFKNPRWPAEYEKPASGEVNQFDWYEHYQFPGRFKDDQHGKDFTQYRIEALRNDAYQGEGESNSPQLQAGCKFELSAHPRAQWNSQWQLVSVRHRGKQPQALEEEAGDNGTTYHNRFSFIPHNQSWRPSPLPKPRIDGPQIAIVTGPEGEEIYTDEYGRVRLKFPWDRSRVNDDKSSCWIRVSQGWAGGAYGMLAIPRIGHEVIVDFLNGDPDQPIVIGRTYHISNRTPYRLPEHKTRTVIRTCSHKGQGYNELRFEDQSGEEEIYVHAQKDMNQRVENDRKDQICHDLHLEVGNQRFSRIRSDDHLSVEGERRQQINGDYSLMVQGSVHSKQGNSQLVECGNEIHLKAGSKVVIEAGSELTISAGGSFIKIDAAGIHCNGVMFDLNGGGGPTTGSGYDGKTPLAPFGVLAEPAPEKIPFSCHSACALMAQQDGAMMLNTLTPEITHNQQLKIVSEQGEPIADYPYYIVAKNGKTLSGRTDKKGMTQRVVSADATEFDVYWGDEALALMEGDSNA